MESPIENTAAILQKAEAWMEIAGIEGVAISENDGKPCLLVFNSLPAAQYAQTIPSNFEGLPVIFEETSIIMAEDPDGLEA